MHPIYVRTYVGMHSMCTLLIRHMYVRTYVLGMHGM